MPETDLRTTAGSARPSPPGTTPGPPAGDHAEADAAMALTEITPPILPPRTKVVIIGAGQAGLSVAYHLRRRGLLPGVDLLVVDRGPATGGAWQFRWESLRLGTAHRVNDLPGMHELGLSFETADQNRPARDVVSEYYGRFEERYGLRVARPVTVTSVRHDPEGSADLLVATSAGIVRTQLVVNASGTWGAPVRPYVRGSETFVGRQLTTPEYRSATDFAGKRVVVVGGGTSAVGFLLEFEAVAATTLWVTRRPPVFGDDGSAEPAVGLESRLAAVAMQDEAARDARVLPSIVSGTGLPATQANLAGIDRGLLVARPMFTRIEPGGVRFADGSFQPADVIIWATGFRAELGQLEPLGLREPGGGVRVERGRSVRDGRVFFAGYGPQASTIGANRAGRLIAVQVLDALQQPRYSESVDA